MGHSQWPQPDLHPCTPRWSTHPPYLPGPWHKLECATPLLTSVAMGESIHEDRDLQWQRAPHPKGCMYSLLCHWRSPRVILYPSHKLHLTVICSTTPCYHFLWIYTVIEKTETLPLKKSAYTLVKSFYWYKLCICGGKSHWIQITFSSPTSASSFESKQLHLLASCTCSFSDDYLMGQG